MIASIDNPTYLMIHRDIISPIIIINFPNMIIQKFVKN